MTTDIRAQIARQLELEGESRQLGADRYRAARPLPWREETSATKEEAELAPGRQLLKLTVEPVADALREFIGRIETGGAGRLPSAYYLLSQVEPEEAAYLAARVIVNRAAIDANQLVQRIATQIANVLIHHLEMGGLKRENRAGYRGLLRAQAGKSFSSKKRAAYKDLMEKEGVHVEFSQADRLHAGMKMIELVCETTGLFIMEAAPYSRGVAYVLRPTEATRIWLERQHARCEILEPVHLPMIVRPRRWRTPFWGGYLTHRPGVRLVKQWASPYHEELRHVDMEPVYRAVNNVQNVPWRINHNVLDVMRAVWDGGGSLGGLPFRDPLPVPPRPTSEDPEVLKGWKAEAADVHQRNAQLLSKRLAMSQKLWIADKFAGESAIWFPHELDFRGRIYPIPVGGPHPQGEDSDKALLEFAHGMPLGPDGVRWLAIHIANLFGVDKVPFNERIEWVWSNTEAILDSARDPLDGQRFWTTADSPYCALAACYEWAGYIAEGEEYVSRIPVALDGSNSGLQHFSAMLRDPVGAAAVNLMPASRPADIYLDVATRAQAFVDASSDPEAIMWQGGKVTRKIAKRPCMTFCYSATRFGMQAMILQTLRDLDAENAAAGKPPHLDGADNYQAALYLSHVLWQVIGETVEAASKAMTWLREAAKVAGQAGLPIWWTTPMGLPVLQAYRSKRAQRVAVHYNGQRIYLVLSSDNESIDGQAMANGIAPNFVHSLDAAHLMAVVNAAVDEGIYDVAVIHDSFGTHAGAAARLSGILRETFVAQYEPNRLEQFRDQLAELLPPELREQLPPLPELGSFDLNQVLMSDYVFA